MQYDLTIRRNITVIQGDSATGKTTLVSMLKEYEPEGAESAISPQCERACVVVRGKT